MKLLTHYFNLGAGDLAVFYHWVNVKFFRGRGVEQGFVKYG